VDGIESTGWLGDFTICSFNRDPDGRQCRADRNLEEDETSDACTNHHSDRLSD
jgi:hypothetical protein